MMIIIEHVQSLHNSIGAIYLQLQPLHFIPAGTLGAGLVGLVLVYETAT